MFFTPYRLWASCLLLILQGTVYAQVNNTRWEWLSVLHDSSQEQTGIQIHNLNFFKNNEYFNPITQGYTLFGTQLMSQLYYIPNPHIRLQAGIFLQQDFGHQALKAVRPLWRLTLQKNGHRLLFGHLDGHVGHRLCEPMYNYERVFLQPIEQGMQYKIDKKNFWADTWLQWEKQQYPGSAYQEVFSAGHSSDIRLLDRHTTFQLNGKLQGIARHQGGQLDTISAPVQNRFFGALGLSFTYKPARTTRWFERFVFEPYWVHSLQEVQDIPFRHGQAIYLNGTWQTAWGASLCLSYWQGHRYTNPYGGNIFQSLATPFGTQNHQESTRELLLLRLLYHKTLWKYLGIDFRAEPHWDFRQQKLEYAYLLTICWRQDLGLVNLNKRKTINP